jgi:hypothetical protein
LARVVALIDDLLFGSRVQADLMAAGHDIELVGSVDAARERLSGAEVLVVDLTDERLRGPDLVEGVRAQGGRLSNGPRTLGFYSHVDTATRDRAQQAGFDLVVPRSRMVREGATLVEKLI